MELAPYEYSKPRVKSLDVHGYIRLSFHNRRVLEHRYVMEQYINRSLRSDEHIHHINGIKTDNRIENLEIVSNSSHQYRHKREFKVCPTCGSKQWLKVKNVVEAN